MDNIVIDKFYDCDNGWLDEEWFTDADGYDDYEILRYCDCGGNPYECNKCKKFKERKYFDD